MKKRITLIIAIASGLACTSGVVLAEQGSEAGSRAAVGSAPAISVQAPSDADSGTPAMDSPSITDAGGKPSADTSLSPSGTATSTDVQAPAQSDTPSAPVTPTIVSSGYECDNLPGHTVQYEFRVDTYSDGTVQKTEIGPQNPCIATGNY